MTDNRAKSQTGLIVGIVAAIVILPSVLAVMSPFLLTQPWWVLAVAAFIALAVRWLMSVKRRGQVDDTQPPAA